MAVGAEFQKALFAALTDANVCGGRVYDRVPEGAVFPYCTIGDEQTIDDTDTCQEAWEIFADIHVWSRPDAGSKVEVKTEAANAVAAALTIASLTGFSLVAIFHDGTRVLRDPDGITDHAIVTMRAMIGPA